MPRSLKLTSISVFLLSLLFTAFFFISKQGHIFSSFNPFAEDPFDAVGSFGIQLSLFAALLCILRSFRPYEEGEPPANQKVLLFRGLIISVLSASVTLYTDLIAMARYNSVWVRLSAGPLLAFILVAMILLTLIFLRLVIKVSKEKIKISTNRLKTLTASFVLYSLIFAIYPSNWRLNLSGEIFTVALGLLLFFLLIRLITNSLFPVLHGIRFDDSIDDIAALISYALSRFNFLKFIFLPIKKLSSSSFPRRIFNFLNPRLHKWNPAVIAALLAAVILTLNQTIGERVYPGSPHFVIIIIIFMSFETGALLLGYFLFSDYLGIFRSEKN